MGAKTYAHLHKYRSPVTQLLSNLILKKADLFTLSRHYLGFQEELEFDFWYVCTYHKRARGEVSGENVAAARPKDLYVLPPSLPPYLDITWTTNCFMMPTKTQLCTVCDAISLCLNKYLLPNVCVCVCGCVYVCVCVCGCN